MGFHGSENGLKEFPRAVLLGAKSDKLVHQPAFLLSKKINIITKRVRVDVPTSHMVEQLQFRDILWDRLLPSLDEVHTLVPDQVKTSHVFSSNFYDVYTSEQESVYKYI